ncbi:MAG: small subunit ribosomal protein S16 [Parcubacteria group bacterium Licking1014_17]|nr:MAG: small subunit ribosomal protein S16 [Parcubacteria group bacterium Licking1014_17]
MLKIRLQRTGKKKQAFFKVVVLEHTKRTGGAYLESLGSYDPHANKMSVDKERAAYWLSNGAQPTGTIHNLFINEGIIKGEKLRVWKPKKREQEKTEEKKPEEKKIEEAPKEEAPKEAEPKTESEPAAAQ